MNSDEYRDRLVDLLLSELVGRETPPNVRARVLKSAAETPFPAAVPLKTVPRLRSSPPYKRSKAPALAIAATLTLLAAAGALIQFQRISNSRSPVLTELSGTIDRPGGRIPSGESLSTGAQSSAVLSYPDGTVVELGPDTTIVVADCSPWDRSKGLELVSGKVDAEVSPQPKGRPMVFSSSDARAEVVGTRLSFDANEDRTRLEVAEGAVRFIPRSGGPALMVESGLFAEASPSGVRSGAITAPPRPGITRFTLMNAETDQPLREAALADGEVISLTSFPTREINIRADFEGEPPASVTINVTRHDGDSTGLPPYVAKAQEYPPFFAAGDHWNDGRPNDCRAWTPRPGLYHISAEATYAEQGATDAGKPLSMDFQIAE